MHHQTPHECLVEIFGYDDFREGQEDVVNHVVGGGDALVLFPTGRGKSVCFQIPGLCRAGLAVVISPLLALMHDQVEALRLRGINAATLNSTTDRSDAMQIEADAISGDLQFLYVSPERFANPRFQKLLAQVQISLFAIDEAHCISEWGHDFRPEYMQLATLAARYPGVPRIALTASADPETREHLLAVLDMPNARVFTSSFDRPNIDYSIRRRGKDPKNDILEIVQRNDDESGIVYCMGRASVDKLAGWLQEQGVKALPYHAAMSTEDRKANQDAFIEEPGIVIVATVAFGMGIDKPDVRFVVHHDMPSSVEALSQETGRAGRDGLPAEAVMFYGPGDLQKRQRMIRKSGGGVPAKRTEQARLNGLLGVCETPGCRRQAILCHFGEDHDGNCGSCDNCRTAPPLVDRTEAAHMILDDVVAGNGRRSGADVVLDVSRSEAEAVANIDLAQWNSILRQMISIGLLRVDHAARGVLRLTANGRRTISDRLSVMLRGDVALPVSEKAASRTGGRRPKAAPTRSASATSRPRRVTAGRSRTTGNALLDALRRERSRIAKKARIKNYFVFHDKTLEAMASTKPRNGTELARLHGVGPIKLERYGGTFLSIIANNP